MTDQWTHRLSEYLDGELSDAERVELEEHLRRCDTCIATLRDLRSVVARARALEDRPPVADLWGGISTRIGSTRAQPATTVVDLATRRRVSASVPQLLAAGIALMMVTGGAVWLAARGPQALPSPAVATVSESTTDVPVRPVIEAAQYAETIAELEHVLSEHRHQLDSTTVEALFQSLAIIDQAITEAEAALRADPANGYLNGHLADTMRRKIHLLSRAASLVRATS